MRKLIVLVVVLVAFVEMSGRVLEACGAKFLVAMKSPRLQQAQRTIRPAAILVYQHNDDRGLVEFVAALRNALNGVGHKVTVVTSEAALRDAARRHKFNVMMMQLDAARLLRNDLTASSPGTAILPMKEFVTNAEAARVKEEFGQMLTLPTTDLKVLSVVKAAYK
jgi:hypothetical protein